MFKSQMQHCPIKGVEKIKGGCPRGSLQWDWFQVHIAPKLDALKWDTPKLDAPKQVTWNSKPRGPHLCLVGRHQRITERQHLMEGSKTRGILISNQIKLMRWSGTYSRVMIEWILGEDIACWLQFMRPPGEATGLFPKWKATLQELLIWWGMTSMSQRQWFLIIIHAIHAILYVGRQSAGEGLTEEEAEACVKHFSPYIKWRKVAIEREFQALMLAEGCKRYGLMRLKASSPSEDGEDLELLSPHLPFLGKYLSGWTVLRGSFSKGWRITGGQDITVAGFTWTHNWPHWIGTILFQVDNSHNNQEETKDGNQMLVNLDITQRTTISIWSPSCL